MSILYSIVGFVIAIGVLVAFHEFGHYWVARRLGVKVLRYSIGFGKPLLSWRRGKDNTEYVIAAIPLGGYVKMLDEREGEVPEAELHRAFNRQRLGVRTAIVAAGPVFNLLFAVAAYWVVFVAGNQELRPLLGEVLPDTPAAAAGFQRGEEVVAVGGDEIQSWDQLLLALLDAGVDREVVAVRVRDESGEERIRQLDLSRIHALGDDQDYLKTLGLRLWLPEVPAVVGEVLADSPAARAGLKPGERIVAVDGRPVGDWTELVDYVGPRPGQTVKLTVEGETGQRAVEVTLAGRDVGGRQVGTLGIQHTLPAGASELRQRMFREVRYDPLTAAGRALTSTWTASALTVKVLWRMLVGEASIKNLSGPINIAQYAGDSVSLGLAPFLKFLALVSVSLAVLNLLPLPVLDGGHLLYYGIEAVRGRPLSEQAQVVGQQIGIAVLLMLMTVAFYNDIARLLS